MKTKEDFETAFEILEDERLSSDDKIEGLLLLGWSAKEIYLLTLGMADVLIKKAPCEGP